MQELHYSQKFIKKRKSRFLLHFYFFQFQIFIGTILWHDDVIQDLQNKSQIENWSNYGLLIFIKMYLFFFPFHTEVISYKFTSDFVYVKCTKLLFCFSEFVHMHHICQWHDVIQGLQNKSWIENCSNYGPVTFIKMYLNFVFLLYTEVVNL